jgi:phosphonate transport system substrate-binding protein
MKRRQFIQILMATAASGALTPLSSANWYRQEILMGIFPRRNTKVTYRMFSTLASHLSAMYGAPVKLESAKNFKQFWENVQQQKYDLVHFNQYHYVVAYANHGYQAIAMNEENGSKTLSGSIITRKDSGIETLADLKDKTIVFGGGPRAMQSFIIPTWLLEKQGISKDQYKTEFARTPPNAIFSVYHKQADAAGAGDAALKMKQVQKAIQVSNLKYLALSDPQPHLPWAISTTMPEEQSKRLQSALLSMNDDPFGKIILKKAGLTAIHPAVDSDYDGARKIIVDVYGEDFGVSQLK